MSETPGDTPAHCTRALGEAVIRLWSDLHRDMQHRLFEAAVAAEGEAIRTQLAELLHDKHRRTSAPHPDRREPIEPDSLGG